MVLPVKSCAIRKPGRPSSLANSTTLFGCWSELSTKLILCRNCISGVVFGVLIGCCGVAGTIMFLHWLAGMIFIFYLASFVMLLREVLRSGVLWFLRNLNDQNFHPIQEVVHR